MAKFEILRSVQIKGEPILPGTAERPVFVDVPDEDARELERRGVGKRVRDAKAEKPADDGKGGQGSGKPDPVVTPPVVTTPPAK